MPSPESEGRHFNAASIGNTQMNRKDPKRVKVEARSKGKKAHVGEGNYSLVLRTNFEGEICVVKAVKCYKELQSPDSSSSAEREQDADISIEVDTIRSGEVRRMLDWSWLPDVKAVVTVGDVEARVWAKYTQTLEFEPAVLIYMEELDERLDHYVKRVAKRPAGVRVCLKLMCDLLAAVVALSRCGLRHNDLMMRNVMLRTTNDDGCAPDRQRALQLNCANPVYWTVDYPQQLVIIDFGLASVSASSPVEGISHHQRDLNFASANSQPPTGQKVHPLLLDYRHPARDLIDLHCLGHSFHQIGNWDLHTDMVQWCRQTVVKIGDSITSAGKTGIRPLLETVVFSIIPQQVLCDKH